MLRLGLSAALLTIAVALAGGQQSPPPLRDSIPDSASTMAARCGKNGANPRRRSLRCSKLADKLFDMNKQTLTRDWDGARTDLAKIGIVPTLSYVAQPMVSDVSIAGGRGWSWADQTTLGVSVDLGKLAARPGLQFYMDAAYASGPILAAKIGTLYGQQSDAAGYGLWLGNLYFQQDFLGNALQLAVGRMNSAASFAALPVGAHYLNEFIAYENPFALYVNDIGFTAFPTGVQWAAQALYILSPSWELGVSLSNNNPYSSAGNDHGLDWKLQEGNHGALWNAQLNFLTNPGAKSAGLPGLFALGAYYDGNSFATLASGDSTVSGTYSVYAQAQQRVTRPGGPGSARGITLWGTLSYSGKQIVSEIPFSGSGGLSWDGPFASRAEDVTSAGCAYGKISTAVPNTTAETVCEWNYEFALAGWLNLTGDYQRVWRPAGTSAPLPGATILGLQLSVVF